MSAQSSNFAFLATNAIQLAALGAQAERYFAEDAAVCLFKLRQFGEVMAQTVAAKAGLWASPEERAARSEQERQELEALGCPPHS
ncbi:MAG TPA: hypothetical protein VGE72_14070 [Azospirillum sp.]